ncbi:zinc finger protein 879-like [Hyposmocoma kahamanoa]|uniref:zinc finger protein 879-like n=1 Tax=Hyposmocoma kahamanoa TaxID=1477025 RepID=UPI000E6D9E27|nr:zinc finger protein 879-like [Hyposmocoma kahamanoa]
MTALKRHLQLVNINTQQYKCTMCPRTFKQQLYLDHHCARVHNQIGKKFMCSACGHAFAYLKDLNTHYKNVHNEENKQKLRNKLFYCKICGKSFKNGVAVTIHTRSAHTGERPAVCTVCDAKFFHADYLKEHMRLHTGETPYKCPICHRGYAQRGNMLSHVKHNHRKSQHDETLLKSLKPHVLKVMRP